MVIDISAWPRLRLIEAIADGNRNEVWRADLDGLAVAVRRSRRSAASLSWELDLIEWLERRGFCVPTVVPTSTGVRSADGVVVQRWIEGRPPDNDEDWLRVGAELSRLHATTVDYQQRPGCCTVGELVRHRSSVDADLDKMPPDVVDLVTAVFAQFSAVPMAVVHGDPCQPNLRLTSDGRVGLLDWDESRVDVVWHDLSPLGVPLLPATEHTSAQLLSNAWEAANGWIAEPNYARRRLADLVGMLSGRTGQYP